MGKPERYAEVLARIAGAAPESKYIRAYHGSPHDFDKFDASKIDTGEGAQAYGHGLYFAGSEDVARSYRDSLKHMVPVPVPEELDGQLMQVIGEIGQLSGQRGKVVGSEWDVIQKQLDEKHNLLIDLQHRWREAAKNPGRMYEVEISHPEDALLDWDRPLRSQGRLVSERLAPFRTDTYDLSPGGTDYETGATALHRIADAFDSDMSEAAAALFKSGIPGIRYLDHGSRSAGKGTRNYVMFPGTEDQIRILRKYAVPGAIGAGAGMQDQPQSRPSPSY